MSEANADLQLEPCPFCGGKATAYKKVVACDDCGAEGPSREEIDGDQDAEAVRLWNARVAKP